MSSGLLTDNLNLLWSSLIVAELVKNGLDTFFISPGNRNAPLIAALACEERAVKKICLDERAAGYRALGHAKATGRSGVLVCTSGTAPANYYPAVIEAAREEIPLVILSADRPPELVGSDANQTIIQPDLFGRYGRESLFLPRPSADYPLEALLAKVDSLVARPVGPVHINCPFGDPLIPGVPDRCPMPEDLPAAARRLYERKGPHTVYPAPAVIPTGLEGIAATLRNTGRGLAVVGRLDSPQDVPALEKFLEKLNWPVFCDIASSLKGRIRTDAQIFSLDHPEAVRLVKAYLPETILQFGTGLVSKHYYASILPQIDATLIQISPRGGLRDPAHRASVRIQAPVHAFIDGLNFSEAVSFDGAARLRFLNRMDALHRAVAERIEPGALSYPRIASIFLDGIPEGEGLFLGNSTVIRAFDATLCPRPRRMHVISNRGASGIEGNIATSVGFAEAAGLRVTAVIGDISFLHDLNSLLLLHRSETPVVLVVINNGGGRIFERLPVGGFPELMDPYLITPHAMDFHALAEQFALPYFQAGTADGLAAAYDAALRAKRSALVEVTLSPAEDLRMYRAMQQVRLDG